jgi:predicted metal-dependent enzyme (double-stranded beta helix superfamily)
VHCEDFRVASFDADTGRSVLERQATRIMTPGEIDLASGKGSIHRVTAGDARALTLHVYAKPMDACTNFTDDGAAWLAASRYDNRPA